MTVRFLHIGDSHLGPTPESEFPGNPGLLPYARAQALVEWINTIPTPIDFVIHTGDVSHFGQLPQDDGKATRLGAELFQKLNYPLHVAVGNHDNRTVMNQVFGRPGGIDNPSEAGRRSYRFTISDNEFIVLDARDTREIDPRGRLCREQLHFLEEHLQSTPSRSVTVFIHYAPIAMHSDWIDRTMLIENGRELHEVLKRSRVPIRGVFHGHVHRGMHQTLDGILYSSVGGTVMQFDAWPALASARIDRSPILFANYVQLTGDGAVVQQLTHCIQDEK